MNYNELKNLEDERKATLSSMFIGMLSNIKNTSFNKMSSIIKDIPSICKMHYQSYENSQLRIVTYNNMHPIRPHRGEIYNAFITEGVGKELSGNHPVIVIQGVSANMYSDKVNVLPIEGDGNKIKSSYQEPLTSDNIEGDVTLLKEQSRIITSDILTLDKARLGKKIGSIKKEKMLIIDKKIKKQLGL